MFIYKNDNRVHTVAVWQQVPGGRREACACAMASQLRLKSAVEVTTQRQHEVGQEQNQSKLHAGQTQERIIHTHRRRQRDGWRRLLLWRGSLFASSTGEVTPGARERAPDHAKPAGGRLRPW